MKMHQLMKKIKKNKNQQLYMLLVDYSQKKMEDGFMKLLIMHLQQIDIHMYQKCQVICIKKVKKKFSSKLMKYKELKIRLLLMKKREDLQQKQQPQRRKAVKTRRKMQKKRKKRKKKKNQQYKLKRILTYSYLKNSHKLYKIKHHDHLYLDLLSLMD